MNGTPAYFASIDEQPLCASCAHASAPWPRDFYDTMAHDRCGAGWLTGGGSNHKCFAYVGGRAVVVWIEQGPGVVKPVAWNERSDGGVRFRQPK